MKTLVNIEEKKGRREKMISKYITDEKKCECSGGMYIHKTTDSEAVYKCEMCGIEVVIDNKGNEKRGEKQMDMKKGKLIIIDSGTDGSGKETQAKLLRSRLEKEGHKVLQISFPNYGTPACGPVELYLNGAFGEKPSDTNAKASSIFYAVDRFASFKQSWGKEYHQGYIIIADRYTTSNMVHQGVKMSHGERAEYLEWLADLEYNIFGLPEPDEVIFLNVNPKTTAKLREGRLNKSNNSEKQDIHESNLEYLQEAYENALNIANEQGWTEICCDAGGSMRGIADIHEDIYKVISKHLD